MDAFILQAVARELDAALRGARFEKAAQAGPCIYILGFACPDRRTRRLLLSADPAHPRLHLTSENPPSVPQPGDFLRSLRKHLSGCRLARVAAGEWERVVQLSFERPAGKGASAFALLAEVMGRWSNLLLLEGKTGAILDATRLSTDEANPGRPVSRGGIYRLPPAQKKPAPDSVDAETFLGLAAGAGLGEAGRDERARWLVRAFSGISPGAASEISARADAGARSLWEAFAWAVESYRAGRFHPSLLLDAQGAPSGLSALEVRSLPPERMRAFPSMNEAADAFYRGAAGGASLRRAREAMASRVRSFLKRTERNLAAVDRDLRQAEAAEDFRLKGELLIRNLDGLEGRAASARLPHDGGEVEIQLDPRYSPAENAQRYFRRYKKLKRLLDAGGRRRQDLEAERAFLEGLLYDVEEAEAPEALAGAGQALEAGGFARKAASTNLGRRRVAAPARPYRRLAAPGGWEIFVGKNALGNEALLRRVARAGDTWLHAQGLPGSHVILRAPDGPPEEALRQAASLAAYHSRGREDSRVRVDYLPVERLRRPRGARPGQVTFTGQRTVLASPEEGGRLLKELSEREA